MDTRWARGGRGSRVDCNGVCIGLGGPHIPISTMATAVPERWVKCTQQVCEDNHGGARSRGLGAQELVPIKDFAGPASKVPDSD